MMWSRVSRLRRTQNAPTVRFAHFGILLLHNLYLLSRPFQFYCWALTPGSHSRLRPILPLTLDLSAYARSFRLRPILPLTPDPSIRLRPILPLTPDPL